MAGIDKQYFSMLTPEPTIVAMITLRDALTEVDLEAAATGRLLDRLPADRLSWRPHPKSMTLGELALHVATIPHAVSGALAAGGIEVAELVAHPGPDSLAQIQGAWAATLAFVRAAREAEAPPDGSWSVSQHGSTVLTVPTAEARRLFMLNHWYHHRGQLTVYLRLLEVPLPIVYANSADENPFA